MQDLVCSHFSSPEMKNTFKKKCVCVCVWQVSLAQAQQKMEEIGNKHFWPKKQGDLTPKALWHKTNSRLQVYLVVQPP